MNAHDVRHLTVCTICDSIGDRRKMIRVTEGRVLPGTYHGRCLMNLIGIKGLLEYPDADLCRLTLGDIGVDAMRAILDSSRQRHNTTYPDRASSANVPPNEESD